MEATRSGWSVVYATLLALASPGMVTVYWVKRLLSLQLERPQMWTTAILVSLVLFGSAAAAARSAIGGLARYAMVCLAVIGILALSYYGLAAAWPAQLWQQYFG